MGSLKRLADSKRDALMKYFVVLLLIVAAVITAFGCTSSPQRSPPAAASPRADGSIVHDGSVGRPSDELNVVAAKSDEYGTWQRLTIEGTSFDVPADREWRIDVVGDPCSDRLERFVLMEHQTTHDRVQVEFAEKIVAAESSGAEGKLDGLTSQIRASFQGDRVLEDRVQKMIPFPTLTSCDPKGRGNVPTLVPVETLQPAITVVVDRTQTPPPVPPAPLAQ